MTKRPCAYCGKQKKLTKEHIFPKFLHNYISETFKTQFAYRSNPRVRFDKEVFELQIRDVCEECNSKKLGILDRYASTFLKKYCLNFVLSKQITIEYDYDLLSRWLLKISYNSARVTNFNEMLFEPYKKYVLDGNKRPGNFTILVGLIKPYNLLKHQKKLVIKKYAELGYIPPDYVRIYNVFFNPLEFLGFLPLKGISIRSFSFIPCEFIKQSDIYPFLIETGFIQLNPSGKLTIPQSRYDAYDYIVQQLWSTREEYNKRVKELNLKLNIL